MSTHCHGDFINRAAESHIVTDVTDGPDVYDRGPGDPEVAIVGGIHGDEPSGVRAVRRLLRNDLDLTRGVRFVIANPPALERDVRFLDSDLNRSFPGDPGGNREERLASQLCGLVSGLPTLSLHATHSQPEPFALVDRTQPQAVELAANLPVPHVVDHHETAEGTFTECNAVVTIEAGCQHSDEAAETAYQQARAFLTVTDALPGPSPKADPTYYELSDAVEKPPDSPDSLACADIYDLQVDNFEQVSVGEEWARIDGEPLIADESFYPILMSECGYANIFGYRGSKLGSTLSDALVALELAE